MKLINKLERKFGKYAIRNLMYYIIILNVVGIFIEMFIPGVYNAYFSLNFHMILKGQIWRLFTFVLAPSSGNILLVAIELLVYYQIGRSLENIWGSFRFNLYYFSGIILTILATLIVYLFTGVTIPLGLVYVNRALFFAFATVFPNLQFLLFFIIPIKAKYLAYFNGFWMALDAILAFKNYGFAIGLGYSLIMAVALGNYLVFFLSSRNYRRISPKEIKRKQAYRQQVVKTTSGPRHKCSVCGRTEEDDENLEFRFCSKCHGDYEYCMEHLFTHEHVHK